MKSSYLLKEGEKGTRVVCDWSLKVRQLQVQLVPGAQRTKGSRNSDSGLFGFVAS